MAEFGPRTALACFEGSTHRDSCAKRHAAWHDKELSQLIALRTGWIEAEREGWGHSVLERTSNDSRCYTVVGCDACSEVMNET